MSTNKLNYIINNNKKKLKLKITKIKRNQNNFKIKWVFLYFSKLFSFQSLKKNKKNEF